MTNVLEVRLKEHGWRYIVKLPGGRGGEYHERATEYAKSNFQSGTYTWIGLAFFFTKEEDAILFALKWS